MVNRRTLSVLLSDRKIGTVREIDQEVVFDYENGPHPLDLSISMPQNKHHHEHPLMVNWMDGLLPDDRTVRHAWSSARGTNSDPMSLLATDIGIDCAGAVRFCPPGSESELLDGGGEVIPLSPGEIDDLVVGLARSCGSQWTTSLRAPISLAGWQPKTALRVMEHGWGMPTGAEPTTHIFKPDQEGNRPKLAANEWLCLSTARILGLEVPDVSIRSFDGFDTLIVTRFDRYVEHESIKRTHIEDFCQATGRPSGQKYEAHGGPTVTEINDLLRSVLSPSAAETDVRRFADYTIYNWLVANTDNHAKNHSLVHTTTGVRLAPLYDVCSLLTIRSDFEDCFMSFRIGGEDRVGGIGIDHWGDFASCLRLPADTVLNRVRDLAARLPQAVDEAVECADNWDKLTGHEGLVESVAPLADAIAGRAQKCAATLTVD